jgi:hypothetical protein
MKSRICAVSRSRARQTMRSGGNIQPDPESEHAHLGRATGWLSSDVAPSLEVVVAVKFEGMPPGTEPSTTAENSACPPSSVVVTTSARNVSPSTLPGRWFANSSTMKLSGSRATGSKTHHFRISRLRHCPTETPAARVCPPAAPAPRRVRTFL